MTPTPPVNPTEDPIRRHSYDGIQEYDKRLPNWWLYTLYATIVFWVGYWGYYEWIRAGPDGARAVEAELARIETTRLASAVKVDDASLWQMSRNPAFVGAGKATFDTNCVACHLPSLRGKGENPTAIGPDLTDTAWIHGGRPTEVFSLIEKGILAKGMPTWGPVLGTRKITETVAYILSKHREGEPVRLEGAAPAPGTSD
ncbi:MAG: cbb3-type cytochrome c oxidase N-terminal domain-containing protein [Opitutaceae bacterium]|nr:cbb3-type cytochrome c oxidase N-terminal domain-containing protein [Opitutaceae bacterium]